MSCFYITNTLNIEPPCLQLCGAGIRTIGCGSIYHIELDVNNQVTHAESYSAVEKIIDIMLGILMLVTVIPTIIFLATKLCNSDRRITTLFNETLSFIDGPAETDEDSIDPTSPSTSSPIGPVTEIVGSPIDYTNLHISADGLSKIPVITLDQAMVQEAADQKEFKPVSKPDGEEDVIEEFIISFDQVLEVGKAILGETSSEYTQLSQVVVALPSSAVAAGRLLVYILKTVLDEQQPNLSEKDKTRYRGEKGIILTKIYELEGKCSDTWDREFQEIIDSYIFNGAPLEGRILALLQATKDMILQTYAQPDESYMWHEHSTIQDFYGEILGLAKTTDQYVGRVHQKSRLKPLPVLHALTAAYTPVYIIEVVQSFLNAPEFPRSTEMSSFLYEALETHIPDDTERTQYIFDHFTGPKVKQGSLSKDDVSHILTYMGILGSESSDIDHSSVLIRMQAAFLAKNSKLYRGVVF
ncbi:MAG: hypothetical protein HY860_01060 [Chlamydiales bacterium]|nr:hypothetical protein [Chlamydiales bacterium]